MPEKIKSPLEALKKEEEGVKTGNRRPGRGGVRIPAGKQEPAGSPAPDFLLDLQYGVHDSALGCQGLGVRLIVALRLDKLDQLVGEVGVRVLEC